jgi:hypothetical protein
MQKKYLTVAIAAVMVAAAGFVAADMGSAGQCDGKTTSVKTAQASSCNKTAQASACTWTRTASAAKLSAGKSCSSASAACCADAKSAAYAKSGKASCCAASARHAHYAQVKKIADPVAERENSRVSMAGVFRCGLCDLDRTDKCQAFIKTAEGRMVPLKHDAKVKGMCKSGQREFEVTGRVKSEGGIAFVEVTNFEAL